MHNPVRPEEWEAMWPALQSLLPAAVDEVQELYRFRGVTMLELGNKLNPKCGPDKNETVTYKAWFTGQGMQHVSVDINGEDGALPIDLRRNLRDALAQRNQPTQYDIITNIGTTEHVRDSQTAVWANLWQCLKPGGWLVCCTPMPGDWWWHGEWYPTSAFYQQLATRNGMVAAWISQYGQPPRRCLCFRARKPVHGANVFTMPDMDTLVYNKMRGPDDQTAAFHNLRYLRINARRLEHLATLALPVEQRTVLELGAGIGDLTSFFLDRGCSVTSVEPRSENIAAFRARYAESPFWPAARLTIIQADAAAIDAVPELAPHQVVFCYGLLYHLDDPAVVLRRAAALCTELMILETVVAYGREDDALEIHKENPCDPNNSVSGQACKPSRRWVFNRLRESFPFVYMPRTQPAHDQFRLDWTSREIPPGRSRAIFVASRQPLDSLLLVERVPDLQFHRTGPNQTVPACGAGDGGRGHAVRADHGV